MTSPGRLSRTFQFKGANFTSACLSDAALNATDLIGANFTKANLSHADFTGASLNEANYTLADMSRAYLGNTILTGAELVGAKLNYV